MAVLLALLAPRCGGPPGPLGGGPPGGSHFDEAVVAVVLQVSRDLVFGAPGHVGVTSPSSCPEK